MDSGERGRSDSFSTISSHPDADDEGINDFVTETDLPGHSIGLDGLRLDLMSTTPLNSAHNTAEEVLISDPSRNQHVRKKMHSKPHHPSHTFRRVQRVSRHAALATKQQLWDSNAASIDAALSAVNQWEAGYLALRGLAMGGAQNIGGFYNAAKIQASKLEHGLWKPIRDWILLPALFGMERAVSGAAHLVQQHHRGLYEHSQNLARTVPVVGESLLEPTLFWSVELTKRTWEILQYPIPSKQQVVNTVDSALTGTKWALSVAGRESLLYMKRADAILTRTLSTTQWKVLGIGPYATLDTMSKVEVINHLCERYFSLAHDSLARYELAAHVRRHNPPLYQDLVLTGVLQERGGDLTRDDEWLSTCPVYRNLETPFLLGGDRSGNEEHAVYDGKIASPLWFRLPSVNGKKPGKDAPWIPFRQSENVSLEKRFLELVRNGIRQDSNLVSEFHNKEAVNCNGDPPDFDETVKTPTKRGSISSAIHSASVRPTSSFRSRHPTVAKWYDPDMLNDVMVDQMRAAVIFRPCCSKCRDPLDTELPLVEKQDPICRKCASSPSSPISSAISSFASLSPPALSMLLRPTCWRFHGQGDSVRRASWFLDTARHGLQPFDDEASGILEDAYLFLKWMSLQHAFQTDEDDSQAADAILTVEVPCPDGHDRLVQFTSLTRATAIQKGLASAIAIFKRRVYRGAHLFDTSCEVREDFVSLEDSLLKAVEDHGALGDTLVPDMSIRSALTPVPRVPPLLEQRVVPYGNHPCLSSLAVPPEQLEETMGKSLDDEIAGRVDHLVLVVHGIGEMLRTIDLFGLAIPNLSSIIDCCAFLRKNHSEVQDAHFAHMYPSAAAGLSTSTGRVEYLPVEWHEAFTILSQRRLHPEDESRDRKHAQSRSHNTGDLARGSRSGFQGDQVMIRDISLRTIPNMREFANDTLLDVLYFMSPEHHDVIIDIVTSEMNTVVDRFRRLTSFNGRVSIVGHSLGSIIAWDILSHQVKVETKPGIPDVPSQKSIDSIAGYMTPSTEMSYIYGYEPEVTSQASYSSQMAGTMNLVTTRVPSYAYPQLEFDADNFFLLGSPVAVFLMIRNQRKPLAEDFALPGCRRVFNIFHPYDPVAYRLEPCIDPRNADIEPTIMTHWNGGFRVHYQTKRLWRKFIDTTWQTQQNVVEAFEARMAAMGLIDSAVNSMIDDDMSSSDISAESRANRVTTGALNQGRRIDYMLQEKEIENANEYVAALAAHSSYWIEKDLSLFVARQICLSKHAAEIDASYPREAPETDS